MSAEQWALMQKLNLVQRQLCNLFATLHDWGSFFCGICSCDIYLQVERQQIEVSKCQLYFSTDLPIYFLCYLCLSPLFLLFFSISFFHHFKDTIKKKGWRWMLCGNTCAKMTVQTTQRKPKCVSQAVTYSLYIYVLNEKLNKNDVWIIVYYFI